MSGAERERQNFRSLPQPTSVTPVPRSANSRSHTPDWPTSMFQAEKLKSGRVFIQPTGVSVLAAQYPFHDPLPRFSHRFGSIVFSHARSSLRSGSLCFRLRSRSACMLWPQQRCVINIFTLIGWVSVEKFLRLLVVLTAGVLDFVNCIPHYNCCHQNHEVLLN